MTKSLYMGVQNGISLLTKQLTARKKRFLTEKNSAQAMGRGFCNPELNWLRSNLHFEHIILT